MTSKNRKGPGVTRRQALGIAGIYGVTVASTAMGFLGASAGTSFAQAAKSESEKKAAAAHQLTMALDGTLNLHPDREIVPDSFWLHGVRTFKKHVEEASDGKIYVDLHDASTLGSQTAALKKVQQGIVQGASCSTQNAAQLVPIWNVIDVPYALMNTENFWKLIYSSEFNKAVREPSSQARVELLSTVPHMRWIMAARSVDKEIRKPEDLSGLKIRVTGSAMEQAAMGILPCSPTPIAWAELLSALKDGAVELINHTPTSSLDGGLAPSLGQIVDPDWMPHWDSLWVSSAWVARLPEELQETVREGGYLAQTEVHDTYADINRNVIGISPDSPNVGWKKAGVAINRLTDAERQVWIDTLSVANNPGIFDPLIDRFGREAYETVLSVVANGSTEQRRWWK